MAGLLVVLYAQWPAISRLILDHLDDDGEQARMRLSGEPVVLPKPLADPVRELAATRWRHAGLGDQGTSPSVPRRAPARPISAFRLAERLRQPGLRSGQARSAALFQLATELPSTPGPAAEHPHQRRGRLATRQRRRLEQLRRRNQSSAHAHRTRAKPSDTPSEITRGWQT